MGWCPQESKMKSWYTDPTARFWARGLARQTQSPGFFMRVSGLGTWIGGLVWYSESRFDLGFLGPTSRSSLWPFDQKQAFLQFFEAEPFRPIIRLRLTHLLSG